MLDLAKLNEKFDVILGYEIIEHLALKDGNKYIDQAGKTLSQNGKLLLSSYFPHIKTEQKKVEQKNRFHLHIYTKHEMTSLLAQNGFSRIRFLGDFFIIAEK